MDQCFDNKRKYPRHEVEWSVFMIQRDKKIKIGHIADISISGIKIILEESVFTKNEPERYDLTLFMTDSPEVRMHIAGRIVWSVKSGDSLIIGLELAYLDKDSRKKLERHIENQEELSVQIDLDSQQDDTQSGPGNNFIRDL